MVDQRHKKHVHIILRKGKTLISESLLTRKTVTLSLNCRANMLNKKIGLCSDSVKILFVSYFVPIFAAGRLWCDFTQSVYNMSLVSYNNSFTEIA